MSFRKDFESGMLVFRLSEVGRHLSSIHTMSFP